MAGSWTAASFTCSPRWKAATWRQCLSALRSSAAWVPMRKVLARYNGDPVLVEQGRHLVATFHPELSSDDRIHRLFLDKSRMKKRVLFLCLGNICRSPMAEAMARKYGSDVLEVTAPA